MDVVYRDQRLSLWRYVGMAFVLSAVVMFLIVIFSVSFIWSVLWSNKKTVLILLAMAAVALLIWNYG